MSAPTRKIIHKLRRLNAKIRRELAAAQTAAADDPSLPITSPLAEEIAILAIAAVIEGPTSTAWKNYIRLIIGPTSDDSPQFKRLTFQDNLANEQFVRKSNAYIVSNGVCGSHTQTNTLANVETTGTDTIDKDLNPETGGDHL